MSTPAQSLPPRTADSIYLTMETKLKALLPVITNYRSGSVVNSLLRAMAEGISGLYGAVGVAADQAFHQHAAGKFLDFHAGQFGVARKKATFAEYTVRFLRSGGFNSQNIPQNTVVYSIGFDGKKLRFLVREQVTLLGGDSFVLANVRAEAAGIAYNLGANTPLRMETVITEVSQNLDPVNIQTTVAQNDETDDELRGRLALAWESKPQLGAGELKTAHAYVYYARSIDGVSEALVNDQQPHGEGTVEITINPNNAELITQVRDLLDTVKCTTAKLTVIGATAITCDITLTIDALPTYTSAHVTARVRAALELLFPAKIGEPILLGNVIARVMAQEGAANVVAWSFRRAGVPVAGNDISIGPGEYAVLGAVMVNA